MCVFCTKISVDCAKKESKILQSEKVNFPDSKTTPALTVGEISKTASIGNIVLGSLRTHTDVLIDTFLVWQLVLKFAFRSVCGSTTSY